MSALGDGFFDGVILAHVPVFVMADAEEGVGTRDLRGIEAVHIGTIRDVVAVLFHPVGEREFPQQKFARAVGEGMFKNLGVLRVRPVKAHGDIHRVRAARIGVQ